MAPRLATLLAALLVPKTTRSLVDNRKSGVVTLIARIGGQYRHFLKIGLEQKRDTVSVS